MRLAAPLLCAAAVAVVAAFAVPGARATGGAAFGARQPHRIAFGVFTPGAPEDAAAIERFSARVGRRPVIWHTYRNWDQDPFPRDLMQNPRDAGAVPMITWEPHGRDLGAMARGRYDAYIRDSARQAVAWGHPVLLRFAHEMNGDWYSWGLGRDGNTAARYVAAWRHVVRVFRRQGATNVRWVWAPNTGRFDALFPGERWVDYVGLDGYNWGSKDGDWQSFEQVFDSSYRAITRLSRRPLMITEFGANARGGDKAAWIRHAFSGAVAERYPRIRALIWFDKAQDGADWRVDSSTATLDAFRSAVRSSRLDLSAGALIGGPDAGSRPPAMTPAAGGPLARDPAARERPGRGHAARRR